MTARPRVQFVTYEASRTGSPLLLLRFLRWLHDEGSLELDVVCWRGGPLVEDFAGPFGRDGQRHPIPKTTTPPANAGGLGAIVGRRRSRRPVSA